MAHRAVYAILGAFLMLGLAPHADAQRIRCWQVGHVWVCDTPTTQVQCWTVGQQFICQ